jgi:hypothetical protein
MKLVFSTFMDRVVWMPFGYELHISWTWSFCIDTNSRLPVLAVLYRSLYKCFCRTSLFCYRTTGGSSAKAEFILHVYPDRHSLDHSSWSMYNIVTSVCVLDTFRCVLHCAAVTCLTEKLQATSAILDSFLLRLLRCRAGIANMKNVSVVSVRPFNRPVLSDNRRAAELGHMNYDIVEFKLFCW